MTTQPSGFRFLGATELEIMHLMWHLGAATVRDIYEAIRASRPVAYTTVMTVMTRLATKGMLHQSGTHSPGYIYTPRVTKEDLITKVMQELMTDLQPTPRERRR